MKIAIYGTTFSKEFYSSIRVILDKFKEKKVEIYIYKPFYEFILTSLGIKQFEVTGFFEKHSDLSMEISVMFSIGGDGTYLQTVSMIRNSGIPVVGINSGRLGFLANISKENISNALDDILESNYTIDKRTLIQLDSKLQIFDNFNFALNEFTIHKKDSASMITIQAYLNDVYLNTYWADGLIISTPTGSTAYSMSAGGPILTPDSANFIIAPLAPHNLTVRPVVIPDKYELKLRVEGRNTNYLVSLDHRSEVIDSSIDFVIKRADFTINSIKLTSQNYFETLRNKLMWGLDSRN